MVEIQMPSQSCGVHVRCDGSVGRYSEDCIRDRAPTRSHRRKPVDWSSRIRGCVCFVRGAVVATNGWSEVICGSVVSVYGARVAASWTHVGGQVDIFGTIA